MKLSIDIDNQTEIAAAIPLLQLILGHKFTTGATPDAPVHVQATAPVVFTPTPDTFPALPDPAAIFGGQPAAPDASAIFASQPATLPAGAVPFVLPTAAPSTAGANPFQTAPEVPTAGAPSLPTGTFPSVPPIGAPGSVPTAGVTLPASPASGVELDPDGLPWDARIHASTKTKNADGRWKAKKGINDPAFVAQVKAQLLAGVQSAGQTQPTAPFVPAAAPAPFVPPAVPSLPAQPVAPSASAAPTTFEQFMARATPASLHGVIPPDAVQKAVAACGLPSVVTLQAHPEHVPVVWGLLQQQYPALV